MSLVSFSQGHGRTDQQQRITALKPHVADAQTTGVEQVLAIAPLAVNPACLQATRRFLFQLEVQNHRMAAQHRTTQAKPEPVPAHRQPLNVETVLF
jgi:MoxR-like ATPase